MQVEADGGESISDFQPENKRDNMADRVCRCSRDIFWGGGGGVEGDRGRESETNYGINDHAHST